MTSRKIGGSGTCQNTRMLQEIHIVCVYSGLAMVIMRFPMVYIQMFVVKDFINYYMY